jgi:enoyl-CoA hydratase/carnithine racemase
MDDDDIADLDRQEHPVERGAPTVTSDHELVLSTVDAGVCTLTLNNPERRNAWSLAMEARYFARLDEAEVDPAVGAIVVTGSGSTFCPGLDTQGLSATSAAGKLDLSTRRPQTYALGIRKPMIAAINGACAGIGLMQVLHCDVRFAARGAKFTTAYARRGLPAEYGSSWLLPRLIGVEHALDLLLSARVVEADEAQALGLVSRVCDPETVVAEARAYAGDLARYCSPRSMAAIRRQVYGDLSRSFSDSMVHTLALMQEFAGNPDFAEGVASFVEKRPPQFEGLDPTFRVHSDRGY